MYDTTCLCETCQSYIHLTDGDYEHDFIVSHIVDFIQDDKKLSNSYSDNIPYIRVNYINSKPPRKLKNPPKKPERRHLFSKYVNFTPEQKYYLSILFREYPSVGSRDKDKNRINIIRETLIEMSSPYQKITNAKIMTWFKNERCRHQHRSN
jgi:hemerythrin superfamily protein